MTKALESCCPLCRVNIREFHECIFQLMPLLRYIIILQYAAGWTLENSKSGAFPEALQHGEVLHVYTASDTA